MIPGEIIAGGGDPVLLLNQGRPRLTLRVENVADRPIQVGSHFHFAEANDGLTFDRVAARGHRLDIAPGTAVRFEPGIGQSVDLVPLAGDRIVRGLRGQVAGPLDAPGTATNGGAVDG